MVRYDYLIIGGGMTADAAAKGIRDVDKNGSIGLVSAEPDPPYNRPPLSKGLWKGKPVEGIWRKTDESGVELHLGREVGMLDLQSRRAADLAGEEYSYGKLLLATGGRPRRLPFGGDAVIYFRTVADYRRLRELAAGKRRFAMIGGGFIGSEIAAALAGGGHEVVMIFPEEAIGARLFPRDLALYLNRYYREKGVQVMTGEQIVDVNESGLGPMLRTAGQRVIEADAIVAGIGIEPNVELAQAAGLALDNGVVVDELLRAGRPEVFAAGDVANFASSALAGRMRVEHEDNALTQGRAAGRNMAGAGEPYDHLPFFYSDLFDLGYEAVGELDPRLETVVEWKTPNREGVVYYLAGARVRGVLLWNVWGKVDAARALIADPGPFTAADVVGRIR